MAFPITPDRQLILLPARNAQEASAWGSATTEYVARYQTIHLARDPSQVDWRGYRHVTLVRPDFWPDDLILIIKQVNPAIRLDRIPVDTPEALQAVLSVRLAFDWRYGPQQEGDWLKLWPRGIALIGLHGRSDGELQEADLAIIAKARIEAVKLTSTATFRSVEHLRAINPDMFIIIRPFVSFQERGGGRRVTPEEFFEWTAPDVDRFYSQDASIRYFELHNEPNTTVDGWGSSWNDGAEFGAWFLRVLELFRQRFPEGLFGFPGLSPGPTTSQRMDDRLFLSQASAAAQQADWIGLHSYWVNEREMSDERLGFAFSAYRRSFPEKVLFITEFGNPFQPKPEVAEQYARYYATLRHIPGLGAVIAYVVSTSSSTESPLWAWRDEAGNDMGIAGRVGERPYIP